MCGGIPQVCGGIPQVCGGIPLFESICLQYLEIVFEFDVGVEVSI